MTTYEDAISQATALLSGGDLERACYWYRAALEAGKGAFGAESASLLPALMGLAKALGSKRTECRSPSASDEQSRELMAVEVRGISIARSHLPTTAGELVVCLNRHAGTLWGQGDLSGARRLLEEAWRLGERFEEASPRTVYSMATLADVMLELGDATEALPICRRVVQLEQSDGGSDASLALANSQVGRCLLLLGDFAAAEESLQRAIGLRKKAYPAAKEDRLADLWMSMLLRAHKAQLT